MRTNKLVSGFLGVTFDAKNSISNEMRVDLMASEVTMLKYSCFIFGFVVFHAILLPTQYCLLYNMYSYVILLSSFEQ